MDYQYWDKNMWALAYPWFPNCLSQSYYRYNELCPDSNIWTETKNNARKLEDKVYDDKKITQK